MTGEERERLRLLIDQERRQKLGVAVDGLIHGCEDTYTRHRCRCDDCRKEASAARNRRRQANPEAARLYSREYKKRRAAALKAAA